MKNLILLFALAILFVGCTNKAEEEVPETRNTPINDSVVLPEESTIPTPLPNAETPAVAEPKITLEKAKEIAFKNAKVSEDEVYSLETDIDLEGNRRYYEIDFKAGGYEYEYDIDAESGKILKKDKERD